MSAVRPLSGAKQTLSKLHSARSIEEYAVDPELCLAAPKVTRCACRKLYPTVLMMKSAEDRLSDDLADPLDRPMAQRILIQGQMRSEFVVIAGVGGKDSTQMGVAEDDDVIEADRADQSLPMPVLPG